MLSMLTGIVATTLEHPLVCGLWLAVGCACHASLPGLLSSLVAKVKAKL
jgi:hypothetical protein